MVMRRISAEFEVYDAAFASVIGDEARLVKVADTDAHEGPVYVPDEDALYFTTVPQRKGIATHGSPEVAIKRLEETGLSADNLRRWPQDVLRHTFASMHSAAFKNDGDTSQQLGHGGSLKVFQRHYRDRVEEPQAKAFWELYPLSKIVALPAQA